MKASPDLDRMLTEWLREEAPAQAPHELRRAVGWRLDRTAQARPVALRWNLAALRPAPALAAALLAVVIGAGFWMATTSSRFGGQPTPTPPATPTPRPSPTLPGASVPCSISQITHPPFTLPDGCSGHTWALDPQLSFTVGSGWQEPYDRTSVAALIPPGAGSVEGRPTPSQRAIVIAPDNFFGNGIVPDNLAVYRAPVAISPDGTELAGGAGTTARSLSQWLRARPELVATAPRAVSLGGLPGYQLDITLAPAAPVRCGQPCADFFRHGEPSGTWTFGIAGPEWVRVYILDEPTGPPLLVVIDDVDGIDRAGLLAVSQPVIDSFRFSTAP